MSVEEEKTIAQKFWGKFISIGKKTFLNKKVLIISLVVIAVVLSLTIFYVMKVEKRRANVKKLYVNAFEKYKKVEGQIDKINLDRAGIAINALKKVTNTNESFSENYLAYFNLGNIYALLKKYNIAIKYYKKSMEASSSFFIRPKAMVHLSRIYILQNKNKLAENLLLKVAGENDNFYQDLAYYNLGSFYQSKKNIKKAVEAFKKVRKKSAFFKNAQNSIEVIQRLKKINKNS